MMAKNCKIWQSNVPLVKNMVQSFQTNSWKASHATAVKMKARKRNEEHSMSIIQ